tara:strand:- start:2458 stop:3354 length:897 start_codon:yes stop_codon:yes gene_type:complete
MPDIDEKISSFRKLLTEDEKVFLDKNGFLILKDIPNYLSEKGIDLNIIRSKLDELVSIEKDKGGWEGLEHVLEKNPGKKADPGSNRIANLLNKGKEFIDLTTIPRVLACIEFMFKDKFKLSAASLREPLKNYGLQKIHIDWAARQDLSEGFNCLTCYVAIDEVNKDNGAVSVIPGSHNILDYPQEYIDVNQKHPKEIDINLKVGEILILNSLLWHRGNVNSSGKRRRTIFIEYRNRALPQGLNQQLYISDEVKNSLTDFEKWILMVGKEYPTDKIRHHGAGDNYRKRYKSKSAHDLNM